MTLKFCLVSNEHDIKSYISDLDEKITADDWGGEIPFQRYLFYGCYTDKLIGLCVYHFVNRDLVAHFSLLKDFRQQRKTFGEKCIQFGFMLSNEINLFIPTNLRHVIVFSKSLGFKEVSSGEKTHLRVSYG